jgi:hypothetical protein
VADGGQTNDIFSRANTNAQKLKKKKAREKKVEKKEEQQQTLYHKAPRYKPGENISMFCIFFKRTSLYVWLIWMIYNYHE